MRRLLVLSGLAACLACGGEQVIFLQLPPRDASVRGMVLGIESDGRITVRTQAVSPGDRLGFEVVADTERISLYYLPDAPDPDTLPEGELARVDEGLCARTLGLPDSIYAADLSRGEKQLSPIPRRDASPLLSTFHYRVRCPCRDYDVLPVSLPGRWTTGTARLDADHLLVATSTSIVSLDRNGNVEHLSEIFARRTLWRDGSGAVWFGGAHGQLYRGEPSDRIRDLELVATSSAHVAIDHIDGSPDPALTDLLLLDQGQNLYRYTSAGLELLAGLSTTGSGQLASLVWLAPGQGVAVQGDSDGVLFYDERDLRRTWVEPWSILRGPPSGLFLLRDLGVALVTRSKEVWIRRGNDLWTKHPPPTYAARLARVVGMIDLPRGFLELDQQGELRQWEPQVGDYCHPVALGVTVEFERLVAFDDHTYAAFGWNATQHVVAIVKERPESVAF